MNDFGYEDDEMRDETSPHFNFGVYLHYWDTEYENSVIPKHQTLKNELLNNKYATINLQQYYGLYEKCLRIYRCNTITASDIGVNNKEFKIAPGSSITINHLISLKVYTDYTEVQKEFKNHC
eukprot:291053_1